MRFDGSSSRFSCHDSASVTWHHRFSLAGNDNAALWLYHDNIDETDQEVDNSLELLGAYLDSY